MIHKAYNKTEIAVMYYQELGIDYTDNREQAKKNFHLIKNYDIEALKRVNKKIYEEQEKILDDEIKKIRQKS